jgi:biopolymer transport protein ExbB
LLKIAKIFLWFIIYSIIFKGAPMPDSQNSDLLNYFIDFFIHDWFASIPIAFCGIITLAVAIDRAIYYSRNQRDLGSFIRRLQQDLEQGNIDGASNLAKQVGGLIGLMTEEGIRLLKHHAKNFSNAFDISSSLYVRDLEKRLSVLATIGATTPFLGLFGTVVGVIVTLKLLGQQGGQSQAVVIGVAKALIATGFGLIVAIIAVILNNWFNSMVKGFENDFQVIKLTLLDYINSQLQNTSTANKAPIGNTAQQYYAPQAPQGNYQPAPQQYISQQPQVNISPSRPQARIVPNPSISNQEGGYH